MVPFPLLLHIAVLPQSRSHWNHLETYVTCRLILSGLWRSTGRYILEKISRWFWCTSDEVKGNFTSLLSVSDNINISLLWFSIVHMVFIPHPTVYIICYANYFASHLEHIECLINHWVCPLSLSLSLNLSLTKCSALCTLQTLIWWIFPYDFVFPSKHVEIAHGFS